MDEDTDRAENAVARESEDELTEEELRQVAGGTYEYKPQSDDGPRGS